MTLCVDGSTIYAQVADGSTRQSRFFKTVLEISEKKDENDTNTSSGTGYYLKINVYF